MYTHTRGDHLSRFGKEKATRKGFDCHKKAPTSQRNMKTKNCNGERSRGETMFNESTKTKRSPWDVRIPTKIAMERRHSSWDVHWRR